MAKIQEMAIVLPMIDLLRAIWYTEGDTMGVPTTDLPESYRIEDIDIDGETITIELMRREE